MRIQAEANLSALIESTEDLILSVDPRLRLITFNHGFREHFEKNFGGPVAPGIGVRELLPPARAANWIPLLERALKGERFRNEMTMVDGRILDFSFSPIIVAGETTGVSVFGKDITEQKAAEKKYRDIFEGALEGFYQITREGRLLTANRTLVKMLGYDSPQEAIACITDTARDLWVDPEERVRVARQIEEQGHIRDYECRFKHKDGSPLWVLLNCRCVRNAGGEVILFEGSIQDVTERKQAVEALQKTEANLTALIESTRDLIWAVDLEYRLTAFNRALQQNIEEDYRVRLALGMRFHEVLSPERAARWPAFYAQVLKDGPFKIEYTRIDSGIMELSFNPILVEGKATGISIFGKDITEQKRSENAIKKAEANLSALIESTQDLIWAVDLEYRKVVFNRALKENIEGNFGTRVEPGMRAEDDLPPERAALWKPFYDRAVHEGPFRTEYPLVDGRILELSFNPILVDGKVVGVSVFGKDITERKQAENQIRDSEARFRNIFEQNGSVMFLVAPESGEIVAANPSASQYYGYSPEQLIGMKIDQINTLPADEISQELMLALNEERNFFNFRHRLASGEVRDVEVYSSPVLSGGKRLLFSIVHDVSERKQAQLALRESRDFLTEAQRIGNLGCYVLDFTSGYWTSTPQLDEVLGISPEFDRSVAGWAELIHPEDRARMVDYFSQEVCGAGKDFDKEYRIVRVSDGTERWVHGMGRLEFDAQGHPTEMRGTIRDITEHKRAEIAIEERERLFRTITENSPLAYVILSGAEDRIEYLNPAFIEIFGYTREEIPIAEEWALRAYPDAEYRCWVMAEWQRKIPRTFASGNAMEPIETEVVCKNGAKKNIVWGFVKIGEHNLTYGLDITEQKRATQALQESEQRYRTAFQTSIDAISITRQEDGRLIDVNQEYLRMFGYEREELIGRTTREINVWTDPADRLKMVEVLRRDGVIREMEFHLQKKNGVQFWVTISGALIDLDGVPSFMIVIRDTSESRAAAETLRDREQLYRATFEQAPVGIVHTALDGRYLRCNDRFAEIIGYPREEVTSLSYQQITLPDGLALASRSTERLLHEESATIRTEKQYIRKDGSLVWVRVSLTPRRDSQGEILYIIAVVEDIQARKMAEERLVNATRELQISEERYRIVFETSPDALVISRMKDGLVLDCNQSFLKSSGFERAEVIGQTITGLGVWADPSHLEKFIDQLQQHSCYREMEVLSRRKNGEIFWIRTFGSLIEIGGEPCRLTFAKEITEVKAAEERAAAAAEALRLSEERYRTAFQTSIDPMTISRLDDGRFVDVNLAFLRTFACTHEEVVGKTSWELNIWQSAADRLRLVEALRAHSFCHDLEFQLNKVDGQCISVLVSGARIELDGLPSFLLVIRDITETKAAEQRLAEAQDALRKSEERHRLAFQTSSNAVNIVRLSDGVLLDVNEAFLDALGYTREEAMGRTTQELKIWVDPLEMRNMVDCLRRGQTFRGEVQLRKKNGETVWGRMAASVFEHDGVRCSLCVTQDITAEKASKQRLAEAAKALQLSEERYRIAFQTSPDAVDLARISDGMILDANQKFLDVTGYLREELIGRTTLEAGIWTSAEDREKLIEMLLRDSFCHDVEFRFKRKNGEVFWARLSVSVIEIGGEQCLFSFAREITEEKATTERLAVAAEALRKSELRYRTAFQTSIDAININRSTDGLYIECNQAFLNILGYERDEVIGKTSTELNIWADLRDRQAMVDLIRQNSQCRGLEVQFKRKTGEIIWGEMSASLIEIDGAECILSITRDITHEKMTETTIRNLAFYDSITGLPNRRYLSEKLSQILATGLGGHFRALLFVELDHFKTLNETMGHLTGDLLLKEIAQRISASAGELDIVCRLGGDEFALMLDDLSESVEEAAAQTQDVGERIRASIGAPCLLDGRECITTASLGCTVFGAGPLSADALMQEADIALYQAKLAGRNGLRFFSPALQSAVNARATLEEDLRQAIKGQQFLLYYQPQVQRGRLIGAEALIRWRHPKNGMVPPDAFIPLAEETGLILTVGDWVLEAACQQIAAWANRKEAAHLTVAVNISALQFRQLGFVDTVLKALERTGANPQNLKLELTESMLVENIEDVISKMTVLKAHGISFSLDDFGTGYSSLAYLKRLPLDQLKIDRAFVRDMLVDMTSGAIAQTVISLGRAMGLSVIAEGVENEEQRGFLAGLGCHAFQGMLFSPPLPLEEFEAFI
ncbi:MAG: PAS domain S-box protein [Terracidiphilus sp.]